MKYKLLNYLALIGVTSLLFTSCIKNEVEDLGDAGKTFLKILESPENALFLEPFTGSQPISLFSVRRDANSASELNKSVTVTIKLDPAAIAAYNAAHGTTFESLPDSLFTLDPSFTRTAPGTYQTTFAPGEFAKEFIINLNGSKWDLAHKYAFPVTITDPGGLTISSDKDVVISLISVKNKYDGQYRVTGVLVDLAIPTITGSFPMDVDLITTGANTVIMVPHDLGIPGHLILSGGALSYYGSYGPVFHFDLNTNKVIAVTNSYGQPAGNTRSAELDPTGANQWNPATKAIDVKYFMKQPSVIPTPPNIRVTIDEHMEYLGPR